jgi:low affinity Fe/Cu permease
VSTLTDRADRAMTHANHAFGSTYAAFLAVLLIVVWAPTLLFLDLDTSQLLINTATTIVTFLMVFVVQNTQNRNDRAVNAKLDALIRAIPGASDCLTESEDLPAAEIERLRTVAKREAERP